MLRASIYNALCDEEWDTPIGEARECGGDALVRCAALDQIGGYNARFTGGRGARDDRADARGRLANSGGSTCR